MSESKEIDAAKALDRFFAIVREEALANPRFASRLVEAAGYKVVFRGSEALPAIDPVQVASLGQEEFRKTFLTFKPAELKKLAQGFNLATAADLKGKTKSPQLVEIMWLGAKAKLHDLGLT